MLSFSFAFSQTLLLVQEAIKYSCCPAVPLFVGAGSCHTYMLSLTLSAFLVLFFSFAFSQTFLLVQEAVPDRLHHLALNFIVGAGSRN
jgi:hypothetical protein